MESRLYFFTGGDHIRTDMATGRKLRCSELRAAHLRLGERGERLAARLLRELGMEILTFNYAGPHGEIDIVGRDGLMLCFVEVKTRQPSSRSRPLDAVTAKKKWHIVRTAERYLRQIGHPDIAYRFDVIEVVIQGWRLREIRHLPAAYGSGDSLRNPHRPFS